MYDNRNPCFRWRISATYAISSESDRKYQYKFVSAIVSQITDNSNGLFNSLLRITTKKDLSSASLAFCRDNPLTLEGFPSQRASDAESGFM